MVAWMHIISIIDPEHQGWRSVERQMSKPSSTVDGDNDEIKFW